VPDGLLDDIMDELDTNQSGGLDFGEFLSFVMQANKMKEEDGKAAAVEKAAAESGSKRLSPSPSGVSLGTSSSSPPTLSTGSTSASGLNRATSANRLLGVSDSKKALSSGVGPERAVLTGANEDTGGPMDDRLIREIFYGVCRQHDPGALRADSYITLDELRDLMRSYDSTVTDEQVRAVMARSHSAAFEPNSLWATTHPNDMSVNAFWNIMKNPSL